MKTLQLPTKQNEIDLLLHRDGILYPVEIKKNADPKPDDVKAFGVLEMFPGVMSGGGAGLSLRHPGARVTGSVAAGIVPDGWLFIVDIAYHKGKIATTLHCNDSITE